MGEYYVKNGRRYFRSTKSDSKEKQRRWQIRELERVRKCFSSNTEKHHQVQLLTGKPTPKPFSGDDEIISGSDEGRYIRRSDIE